ncbi:MAG: NADH-quinone oxidoreductase subunit N [Anaerolineae bacterium]|nr:NADH-quinone oxidoreductase subunit N [Anaerolineae bacterium]
MNPGVIVNNDATASILAILPEILVTALAAAVVLLEVFWPRSRRRDIGLVAAGGLFAIAVVALLIPIPEQGKQLVLGGMFRHDVLTQLFVVVTLVGAAITCLISMDARGVGRQGEFYAIIIVATLGACLISGAADMILAFLAIETLSISLYILAGFLRSDKRSSEAGMKYFLFGAFTSTIMLYGMSLLYGFTGQTNLYAIGERLRTMPFSAADGTIDASLALPILLSMVLIVVGFGFKVSAVPFHFWTPDVYEGAPTPVTAFISVASKAASFALLTRFFIIVFTGDKITLFWVQLIAVLAVVTMTVGNLLALPQRNIKRLIAYSSIAQAGYTLVGVAAIAAQPGAQIGSGVAAVGFYMAMYVLTNLAAFGVIILFANATGSETIADMAGLSRRNIGLALALTVALLSLGGIPPAAGFIGKFFLFRAAVDANLTWLAVVGVLNSIIALYYYLVIIKVMYVDRSEDENKPIPVSQPYIWALAITCIGVVLMGTIFADPIFNWAMQAARGLFS